MSNIILPLLAAAYAYTPGDATNKEHDIHQNSTKILPGQSEVFIDI